MKHVLSDRIICTDGDFSDNRYLFCIPGHLSFQNHFDMATLLLPYRNDAVDYRKDYKLWNYTYPPEIELALFEEIVVDALKTNKKIHVSNVSLREEIEIVRKLYLDLGYFSVELNRFEIDFKEAPITIGVNIRNLVYSTKDYKSKREAVCFLPPPRESWHVKSLFAGINGGLVSMIQLNDSVGEDAFLSDIVSGEKLNLVCLANVLHWNYLRRGFEVGQEEWVLQL